MINYCTVSYAVVIAVGSLFDCAQGTGSIQYFSGTASCTGGAVWVDDEYWDEIGESEEDDHAYADEQEKVCWFSRVTGRPSKFRCAENRRRLFRRWMFRSRATMY